MSRCDDLTGLFAEARRLAGCAISLKAETAATRDAATKNGFDWSQIKALAAAVTADEEAGTSKRLEKLLSRADFAVAYADMLGLRQDERKNEIRSSSSSPSKSVAANDGHGGGDGAPDLPDLPSAMVAAVDTPPSTTATSFPADLSIPAFLLRPLPTIEAAS